MPFNMAVEEPHSGIVRPEANHKIAVRLDPQGVSSHGRLRHANAVVIDVRAGLFLGAVDDLEVVAVQMERVLARISVVQHELDDLVTL